MIAVFVIVARYLGPEAFGLAALAMVVPIVLALPVTQGVPEALIQRAEVQPIHFDSAFWLLTVSGTLLAALICLLAGTIATAFGQPSLADLVGWASITVAIQAVGAVPAAILKRQLDFAFSPCAPRSVLWPGACLA